MKILYILLIVSSVTLLAFGGICLEMDRTFPNMPGNSSTFFSMVSFPAECFALLAGLMGIRQTAKISMGIIIPSAFMLVWSAIIYSQPHHISVAEVLPFWVVYGLAMVFLSVLGFRAKAKVSEAEWDDELLDDLV